MQLRSLGRRASGWMGCFDLWDFHTTAQDAARAYDAAAIELHGAFAKLNFGEH